MLYRKNKIFFEEGVRPRDMGLAAKESTWNPEYENPMPQPAK